MNTKYTRFLKAIEKTEALKPAAFKTATLDAKIGSDGWLQLFSKIGTRIDISPSDVILLTEWMKKL